MLVSYSPHEVLIKLRELTQVTYELVLGTYEFTQVTYEIILVTYEIVLVTYEIILFTYKLPIRGYKDRNTNKQTSNKISIQSVIHYHHAGYLQSFTGRISLKVCY